MLALKCPGCGCRLEIDVGFAGAVCRCSDCGRLLAVPQSLGAAGGRGPRPDAPGRTPDHHASAPLVAEVVEQAGEHAFRTSSGRTIRASAHDIPVARRRRIRVTAATIAILVLAGLLGVSGLALLTLLGRDQDAMPKPTPTRQELAQLDGYDATANPFTFGGQNVLGLALPASTAVAIDASGAGRTWLALAQRALAAGLAPPGQPAMVVFWTEQGPVSYPDQLRSWSEQDVAGFEAAAADVIASGVAEPGPAVSAALASGAQRLVLVTGRALEPSQVQAIRTALAARPELAVDIVLLGAGQAALRELAESRGGRMLVIPPGQLARWYRDREGRAP